MALHRHRKRYIATFTPPTSTEDNGNGNGDGNGKKASSTAVPSDPATSVIVPTSAQSSAKPTSATSAPATSASPTTSSASATSSTPSATSANAPVVTVHSTATPTASHSTFALVTSSIGPATAATSSTTGTPSSSSGSVNVTAVVGAIAGTLVGLAALGFFIMWLIRRRRDKDDEDFNASIFRRQSAILLDEPSASPFNPRPPTMIERHVTNASPAFAAQRNMTPAGYDGYGSFTPGEIVQPTYGAYGESGQVARQPSNAAFLARQPSAAAAAAVAAARGAAISPEDNDSHYVDLSRSSVTPFQAAQYADISRRLNAMDTPRASEDLPRAPLPSPFDDHPDQAPITAPAPSAPAAPRERQPAPDAQRPVSAYTVYEDGDAYGGI